jgi:signal transduction histidine kinase
LSDQSRILIGRVMAAGAMVLAAVAMTLYVVNGEAGRLLGDWVIHNGVTAFALGAVAFLAVPRQPANGAVWVLTWAAVFGALQATGAALVLATTGISNAELQAGTVTVALADLDPLGAIGFMIAVSMWVPGLFLMITLGLLLFPDGSPPSRRWLAVGWLSAIAMAATSVTLAWVARPWNRMAFDRDFSPATETLINALLLSLGVSVVASVTALVIRWRRSEGESRLQFRWIGWAVGLMAVVTLVTLPFDSRGLQIVSLPLVAVIPFAYGVAITKYRLYDIDVVVSRTIVYTALAGFITVVYVGIVAGVGALFGSGDDPSAALAIVATAIVAVAFQPARRWLQHWANRVVYGKKATPYEVLADFSRRVAATDDSLLEAAARSLVEGTNAEQAAIWLDIGDRLTKTVEWPTEYESADRDLTSIPIEHDGVELGMLTLTTTRGQRLSSGDQRLTREVASGMGLSLQNQLLTETLQANVEELRESRRRLVAVQDETRRKLERDLHDGAQQQLVALKVRLGLSRAIAEQDGAPQTAVFLAELSEEADGAVESLRDFARGVYPPLLEAEGLVAAVSAQARRSSVPVAVAGNGIGRHERDVEATVYICVLEALHNVARYADASAAQVALSQRNGSVTFEVADDGVGFDTGTTPLGRGLMNVADRIDAVAGSFRVESSPGAGTKVIGTIPASPRSTP